MIKITVKGIKDTLKEIQTKTAKESDRIKSKLEHKMIGDLRDNTPVDTGHARDSWRLSNDSIVNDADYISDLNAGSSQQAPSHFIESTVLANKGVHPNGVVVKYK